MRSREYSARPTRNTVENKLDLKTGRARRRTLDQAKLFNLDKKVLHLPRRSPKVKVVRKIRRPQSESKR
jgi:hypothetical protein